MLSKETPRKAYTRTLLFGVVMTFAVLDHTRMFFHYWNTDPTNLEQTSPILFFTRFTSHYFAPAVFFLLGIQLYLNGLKRITKKLNTFVLLKQGLFLLLIELLVNNFLYTFDPYYRTIGLFIIGMLGISLIFLAGLHHLDRLSLLWISLLIIGLHNIFDSIHLEGHSPVSIVWYILHQQKFIPLGDRMYIINYTLFPWLGVMLLGYFFGYYYQHGSSLVDRKKILMYSGWFSISLFLILRTFNIYGDPKPWTVQKNDMFTILSFFDLTKYPASLSYLCATLGPICLFLAYMEGIQNKYTSFFYTLGKKPLQLYLISTFLIHVLAFLCVWLNGISPLEMIITPDSYTINSELNHYGFSLLVVYVLWLFFVFVLYFIGKKLL